MILIAFGRFQTIIFIDFVGLFSYTIKFPSLIFLRNLHCPRETNPSGILQSQKNMGSAVPLLHTVSISINDNATHTSTGKKDPTGSKPKLKDSITICQGAI